MPDSLTESKGRIMDLKVAGHLMTLDPGVYCIFHVPQAGPCEAPGDAAVSTTGVEDLPGVRISRAPGAAGAGVAIVTFDADGWLGGARNAALVRVPVVTAQVLITIYQDPALATEIPRLKVVRLAEIPPAGAAPAQTQVPHTGAPQAMSAPDRSPGPPPKAERSSEGISAHIQRRGDVAVGMEDWMGIPGSQAWIEGFSIMPARLVAAEEIEYQAVLGRGWLSPWSAGGQFCGSRGMALPILGLRVRLKPEAARRFSCRVSASFTDGTRVGPIGDGAVVEAASLAPLEAFRIEIMPLADAETPDAQEQALLATVAPSAASSAPRSRPRRPHAKAPPPETPSAHKPDPGASRSGASRSGASRRAAAPKPAREGKPRRAEPRPPEPPKSEASPIDPTRPGRGRKAPGSRVDLLKARRRKTGRGKAPRAGGS
jgi:Clostridial hydrophobic W